MPCFIPSQTAALISAFLAALATGLIMVPVLRKIRFGQTVRDDGPATHLKKTGTPTMGGIIFLAPIIAVSLFYADKHPGITPLLLATLGFGAVGLADDLIKVARRRKDGLYAKQKMFGLTIVAAVFAFYTAYATEAGTKIIVPFLGMDSVYRVPAWIFIPFTILVLISTTNAVNITDGLDGLATGVTLIIMVFFTIVAMSRVGWDYVKIFSSAVAGGCLGFLAFNAYPAKVFMGDTGSLALGGAVGAVAITTGMPWILLVVGFIYVIETLSVALQVISFKTRGKRIFKMAPLHHHFELLGWRETKVVKIFWMLTALFCLMGFLTLKMRFF